MKFDDGKGATVGARLSERAQLESNRSEWLVQAKEISEWLLPGRGVFTGTNNGRPTRTLTSSKIINPKSKQAFEVFVSFLKEGITPSTRPWIHATFKDTNLKGIKSLNQWLFDSRKVLYAELKAANFYSIILSYYKEICGFGTGSIGVLEGTKNKPLVFCPLTFGEYVIGTNDIGEVDRLYRTVYKNFHQLYERFGDKLPEQLLEKYRNRDTSLDYWYTVIEGVVPDKFMDMPFTRFFILSCDKKSKFDGGISGKVAVDNKYVEFLSVEGANEFPYPTTRFDVIGSDEYGVSPAFDAIPVIKQLQEVVKSGAIAFHKSIRPPLNVPVHMKGQVRTSPDAINYYIDPAQIISKAYDTTFDHQSAATQEAKNIDTIKEIFFNDIFLSSARDPNASPLKAREVDSRESERFIRLGPHLERIFSEGIVPILKRSLNILKRKGKLPPIPEEFRNHDLTVEIELTSILAMAMKALSANPVQEFLQVVGGVAQFTQEVLDIPNFDSIIFDMADIKGVDPKHLNSQSDISAIRKARAEAAQQKAQQEQGMQAQLAKEEMNATRASSIKDMSEAGANLSDTMGGGTLL